MPTSRTPTIVHPLLGILVFGVGGTTPYLLVFNRNTRNGLHDLAVEAYVAEADQNSPVATKSIWKFHWMILASLAIVFTVAAVISETKIANWGFSPSYCKMSASSKIFLASSEQQHRIYIAATFKAGIMNRSFS